MKILTFILLTTILLLTSCQPTSSPLALATVASGSKPVVSTPVVSTPTVPAATVYPPPAADAPTGYPAQPGSADTKNPPAAQVMNPGAAYPAATPQNTLGSSFPPQPGDQNMSQSKFFVDSASLQTNTVQPGWTDLMVSGSLPTPCNSPRVQVNPPDNQKKIVVNAYSVFPKDKVCNQMIQPFSGRIAILGGYPTGKYTVMVNDKTAGELNVP